VKVLNLYAGLGGNRKLWEGHEVTSVENNTKIVEVYRELFPLDTVIVGDAHQYLLENHHKFDFVWTSPPCQSHSKMNKFTRHKHLRRYPDMSLYQEIIFLTHFFKGKWVVENVTPYYEPLIPPTVTIGRHLFWSNFSFTPIEVPQPKNFINLANLAGKRAMMDWLGIHYENNHCPVQILRNCVHPLIGQHVLNSIT
jgi:DNA (cytosine-5)-methyltransferase 1